MNSKPIVVGAKKHDMVLQLFMFYVTPLCVYLQSLFFATSNIFGAAYISLLVAIMLPNKNFSMQIRKSDVLLFIFMMIACFSSLRSLEYLYFMQMFLVLVFVFGYTRYDINELYRKLDIIMYFGLICAIACIIQEVWNGFYIDFVSKLFKTEDFESIISLNENKGNCGLMPQTSHAAGCILNSFFIVMLKEHQSRKKFIIGLILILGILLTGKRSHFFMGAFAYFLSFFIGFEGRRKTRKVSLGVATGVLLIIVVSIILPFLPKDSSIAMGVNTILNFDVQDREIMHGREILYVEAIAMGNSAPLTGHGWGYFKKTTEMTDAHNIYLQLFAEQGAIIMALFIVSAIILVSTNIKLLKRLRHKFAENSKEIILARLSFCLVLFFYLYGLSGNCLYNIDFLIIFGLGVSITKRLQVAI